MGLIILPLTAAAGFLGASLGVAYGTWRRSAVARALAGFLGLVFGLAAGFLYGFVGLIGGTPNRPTWYGGDLNNCLWAAAVVFLIAVGIQVAAFVASRKRKTGYARQATGDSSSNPG